MTGFDAIGIPFAKLEFLSVCRENKRLWIASSTATEQPDCFIVCDVDRAGTIG